MGRIKIALAGVGNCASSLVQGIHHYAKRPPGNPVGLMHPLIGGYPPGDIEVVAAFDIDRRKVGLPLHDAIFAEPNCTRVFCPDLPHGSPAVLMGPILDGVSAHMRDYEDRYTFCPAEQPEPDREAVVALLKASGARILLNYLPVGSEAATRFYAECALEARMALINNIPVFIASDPLWAKRFSDRRLPLLGDDIKSQLGATITHRTLTDLFHKRGVKLERTYQLNTGGNTDFLNMLNRHRLISKKRSKTESVQAVAAERLESENIHIGPSDWVPWQKDNKVCFIRMEGQLFGEIPMNLELRLSVEDSPNSAGVAIDMIRCAQLALDNDLSGVLEGPSAFFCKHPPRQCTDDEAWRLTEAFIRQYTENIDVKRARDSNVTKAS